MWDTFKFSVKRVMESGPPSSDDLAKVIAQSYDATVKTLPAGDIMHKNPVATGNVDILENIIKSVLRTQSSSTEQLPIINGIANGFVAYWSGGTLQHLNTPIIPAPGSTGNIIITSNMVSVPGIQVAYQFTYEGLDNVDGFINKLILAANVHLATVQGFTITTSVYPPGIQAPGFIPWSGFSVNGDAIDFGAAYEDLFAQNPDFLNKLKNKFTGLVDPNELAAKGLALAEAAKAAAEAEAAAASTKTGDSARVDDPGIQSNLDAIEKACIKAGITNPKLILAIKANCMKETGGTILVEDLAGYGRTSNERIREIFTKRVNKFSDDELNALKANTVAFADAIYGVNAGTIGKNLGNDKPGDGFKYRGRGFVQLTGKYAYRKASLDMYGDERLVTNPDLLNTQAVSADSAVWEVTKSLNLFSKKLNLNPANNDMSQEDANRLITSIIAGRVVSRGTGSYLSTLLAKVDSYATRIPMTANLASNTTKSPSVVG